MNLVTCHDIPEQLNNKKFNPFSNIASQELNLHHEKFDMLQSSCGYFSFPFSTQTKKLSQNELNIIHINARSVAADSNLARGGKTFGAKKLRCEVKP